MKFLIGIAMLVFSAASQAEVLNFDVFLNDKKIGQHRFEINTETGGVKEVLSDASFDVKFLFFNAFKYRHRTVERWSNGCLQSIDASTNSNGNYNEVMGEIADDSFHVLDGSNAQELPGCVMSFAYWNPEFLKQRKLLNPQTGEYVDVSVEALGDRMIETNGNRALSSAYKISAKNVDVTVWYSDTSEWLALESVVKGGRIIRYEAI